MDSKLFGAVAHSIRSGLNLVQHQTDECVWPSPPGRMISPMDTVNCTTMLVFTVTYRKVQRLDIYALHAFGIRLNCYYKAGYPEERIMMLANYEKPAPVHANGGPSLSDANLTRINLENDFSKLSLNIPDEETEQAACLEANKSPPTETDNSLSLKKRESFGEKYWEK